MKDQSETDVICHSFLKSLANNILDLMTEEDMECKQCGCLRRLWIGHKGPVLTCMNCSETERVEYPIIEQACETAHLPCFSCGAPMKIRFGRAKKESFFGCSTYPLDRFAYSWEGLTHRMPSEIECPLCGNIGETTTDDKGAFVNREPFEEKAVRKCNRCGAGLLIEPFSEVPFGNPEVIPEDTWKLMENRWELDNATTILFEKMFETALMNTVEIEKICQDYEENFDIDAETSWKIVVEFQFLFLHIIDRMAFNILNEEKKKIFMDILVGKTVISTVDSYYFEELNSYDENALMDSMINNYNRSQSDYRKCKKMLPEKNESSKDTIFWEFGKKISTIVVGGPSIVYVMMGMDLAVISVMELIKELKINDMLQDLK